MRHLFIAAQTSNRKQLTALALDAAVHYLHMTEYAEMQGDNKLAEAYEERYSKYLEVANSLYDSKQYYREFVQAAREHVVRYELQSRARLATKLNDQFVSQPALF